MKFYNNIQVHLIRRSFATERLPHNHETVTNQHHFVNLCKACKLVVKLTNVER